MRDGEVEENVRKGVGKVVKKQEQEKTAQKRQVKEEKIEYFITIILR